MLIIPYDIESQSRNADFISIALRAIHHLQRQSRCCPLSEANTTLLHNLPPTGGYNLRPKGLSTFLFTTLLHNPRRKPRPFFNMRPPGRHHNPRAKGPSNLRTLRPSGRSNLRTFLFITLLHNLPPTGGHNPRAEVPSTLTPKACPPAFTPKALWGLDFLSSFTNRGLCDKIT